MLKRAFIRTLAGSILVAAAAPAASAQDAAKSGYEEVNGLKYHYEITGKGEPLLLLHGGIRQKLDGLANMNPTAVEAATKSS